MKHATLKSRFSLWQLHPRGIRSRSTNRTGSDAGRCSICCVGWVSPENESDDFSLEALNAYAAMQQADEARNREAWSMRSPDIATR